MDSVCSWLWRKFRKASGDVHHPSQVVTSPLGKGWLTSTNCWLRVPCNPCQTSNVFVRGWFILSPLGCHQRGARHRRGFRVWRSASAWRLGAFGVLGVVWSCYPVSRTPLGYAVGSGGEAGDFGCSCRGPAHALLREGWYMTSLR